jgi:hypothetical protein
MSYAEPCWTWPVANAGDSYFDYEDDLEQAIFTVVVRQCLEDLQLYLPEERLLRLIHQLRHAVDTVQADLVAEARVRGVSWTRIGDALEVGRTAAQKRYGRGLPRERKDQLERETRAVMEWARDVSEGERDEEWWDEEIANSEVQNAREFLTAITERRGER